MEIEISKLLKVADRILKHILTDLEVDRIQIPVNDYWDVIGDARYKNGEEDPPEAVLGSLQEDWRLVTSIVSAPPAGKLPALVQLSNLLRAIGDHPKWVTSAGINVGSGTEGNMGKKP
jgi:hypothetical protein